MGARQRTIPYYEPNKPKWALDIKKRLKSNPPSLSFWFFVQTGVNPCRILLMFCIITGRQGKEKGRWLAFGNVFLNMMSIIIGRPGKEKGGGGHLESQSFFFSFNVRKWCWDRLIFLFEWWCLDSTICIPRSSVLLFKPTF